MHWSAKLDLPLDIDNLAATRPHAACNPGRSAEPETAELKNAQSVNLPDLPAGRVDQRDVAQDRFPRPIPDTRHSRDILIQGASDIGSSPQLMISPGAPQNGFAGE